MKKKIIRLNGNANKLFNLKINCLMNSENRPVSG